MLNTFVIISGACGNEATSVIRGKPLSRIQLGAAFRSCFEYLDAFSSANVCWRNPVCGESRLAVNLMEAEMCRQLFFQILFTLDFRFL